VTEIPWWITAIVFFCIGATVERYILDRRFIREMRTLHDAARQARILMDVERERPRQSEPPDQPLH
jgi:hypothetical protein